MNQLPFERTFIVMKKTTLRFSAAVMAAFLLFACQKEMSTSDAEAASQLSSSAPSNARIAVTPTPCGMFRTQTQGGWGAPPNGGNPGAYLHLNFSQAFGFLTVGCYPGNYYVKVTSATEITNLLPVGGPASVLTANYTDPSSLRNVLVGQLISLKLSVGFDAWDANFSPSNVALGNMVIASGTFQGKSVAEFIHIADKVLGGCSSAYSVQDVLTTATSINENFDNGTTNNGYLTCPVNGGGGSSSSSASPL